MRIEILPEAKADLDDGYWFYDRQNLGLGEYFLSSVTSDIRSLQLFGGIHPRYLGKFRMLATRFPYSVFYEIDRDVVKVFAVLDDRRDPAWISERLS